MSYNSARTQKRDVALGEKKAIAWPLGKSAQWDRIFPDNQPGIFV